jgi:hypothetical protein
MNLYEIMLRHNPSGQIVHKLSLCTSDFAKVYQADKCRLIMENFPVPEFHQSGKNFFYGVIRAHIRCKDAARRVYLKPAKGVEPVTPFFENFLVAENYMIETYGDDWNDFYSLVYVENNIKP